MIDPSLHLLVSLADQRLSLIRDGVAIESFPVSTAKNGPGEQHGSECTPRGWHQIRARIGAAAPPGAVFVGRRWTGEVYDASLNATHPGRDWILSRILWLSGLEPGVNRLGTVDTMRRYIYIHGAPDDLITGQPESHGCVRMRNDDVIRLFDRITPGTRVRIE